MTPRNRKLLIAAGSVIAPCTAGDCLRSVISECGQLPALASRVIYPTLSAARWTMGKLSLSVWVGAAWWLRIRASPTILRSARSPFLHAESVKINVDVLPLVFSRKLQIEGFLSGVAEDHAVCATPSGRMELFDHWKCVQKERGRSSRIRTT